MYRFLKLYISINLAIASAFASDHPNKSEATMASMTKTLELCNINFFESGTPINFEIIMEIHEQCGAITTFSSKVDAEATDDGFLYCPTPGKNNADPYASKIVDFLHASTDQKNAAAERLLKILPKASKVKVSTKLLINSKDKSTLHATIVKTPKFTSAQSAH